MRQGLVAWLLMGVLALTAFDAFESFKTPQDASTELTTDDVIAVGKDSANLPPTGN